MLSFSENELNKIIRPNYSKLDYCRRVLVFIAAEILKKEGYVSLRPFRDEKVKAKENEISPFLKSMNISEIL